MQVEGAAHTTPANATSGEFQKLIRCDMVGADNVHSVRFVALEYFSLWEHMMHTRHSLACEDYSVCLWMPQETFEQRANLYAHGGDIEEVSRFDFNIFDDVRHYTYAASRFVLNTDVDLFHAAMLAHIPAEIRNSDRFNLEVVPGYCIEKDKVSTRDSLVLGLYGGFHDIY